MERVQYFTDFDLNEYAKQSQPQQISWLEREELKKLSQDTMYKITFKSNQSSK